MFFIADVALQFNKGFSEKGTLVLHRPTIVRSYIRTWFLLDVLASFPYSWVTGGGSASSRAPQLLRLLKFVRFLRVLRILRFLKLTKLMEKLEELVLTDFLSSVLETCKLMTAILYIAHWMACMCYLAGSFECKRDPLCWLESSNLMHEPPSV